MRPEIASFISVFAEDIDRHFSARLKTAANGYESIECGCRIGDKVVTIRIPALEVILYRGNEVEMAKAIRRELWLACMVDGGSHDDT